jgi:Amiloride-sensitive sodium channel
MFFHPFRENGENVIRMNIYYGSTMMERFRTDVTFGWMDLMVAFGGIVSLLLGCSMLSVVELAYFMAVGLCYRRKRPEKVHQIREDPFAYRPNFGKNARK